MSSERRRKSRIQGGWANQTQSAPVPRHQTRDTAKTDPKQENQAWSIHADENVSHFAAQSGLVLGASNAAPVQEKFTFLPNVADVKKEPLRKIIDLGGVYTISTEPSGVSSIRLTPNFIEPSECEWIFEQIHEEVPWKQRMATKAGQTYLQPRLTAWFGEHPYSYSGTSHDLNLSWTPVIQMLKDRIEEVTGFSFNSVLANLYRDGHDHVAWHSDNEVSMGVQPVIASLSFGDTRNFELRRRPLPEVADPDDSDYPEYIKIPLDAGSLLIMEGYVQQDWQHRVPKEYHNRKPRINLTFRTILPP